MSIRRYLALFAAIVFPFAAGAHAADLLTAYLQQQEAGIRSNLEAYYRFDPLIDASAIEVEISGDMVTLHGEVPDLRARSAAVLAAENTFGVATVVDRLHVREAEPPPDAAGARGGPADVNLAAAPR